MKKFKFTFFHDVDNEIREIIIEAFDLDRAKVRFKINWNMEVINIESL